MTWKVVPGCFYRFYRPRVEQRPAYWRRGTQEETQQMSSPTGGDPAPAQLPQQFVDQLNQANGLLQSAQAADQSAATTKAQADQLATQYAGQQAAALSAHQSANTAAQSALNNLMAYFGLTPGIPPAPQPAPTGPGTPNTPPSNAFGT